MPFLALLPKAKLIGLALVGLAIAGAVVYILMLRANVDRLEAEWSKAVLERDMAADLAEANARAVVAVREDAARTIAALREEKEKTVERVRVVTQIRTEIRNAPATDDAALAPVFRHGLDRLRERAAAKAGAANPTGEAGDPARAPDVRR